MKTAVPAKTRNGSAGHRQPETSEGPLTPPDIEATFREYTPSDHDGLVAMYGGFEPKGAFQGLPPHSERLVRQWLDRLRECGSMFFVACANGRIVGHAMLCPSPKNSAELAIFIHQDFRGLGIGKKLLLGVLNHACKHLQLSKVWLSVQGANFPAMNLFQHAGFEPAGTGDPLRWEITMHRPLSCEPCLGDRCAIFGESLPFKYEVAAATRR